MTKTTRKQFSLFEAECKIWIEYFGLKQWQIHYRHVKMEGSRARAAFDCVGGIATLSLNTVWNEQPGVFVNDDDVKKTAFHEVCEILLGRVHDMVEQRWGLIEGDVEEEIHRLIRTLENTIFKDGIQR